MRCFSTSLLVATFFWFPFGAKAGETVNWFGDLGGTFLEPFEAAADQYNSSIPDSLLPLTLDNLLLGYRVRDWRRPTNWNRIRARDANHGDGVTIGIMDTLINCDHVNLTSNNTRTCTSHYLSNRGGSWSVSGGGLDHGSNVAGSAAGTGGYGVAFNANIAGLAVFDDDGWYLSSTSDFVYGVNFLIDNQNATVLNWSLGSSHVNGTPVAIDDMLVQGARAALDSALVVKSGGNQGLAVDRSYFFDGSDLSNVRRDVLSNYLRNFMWVGALNYDGTALASFSAMPGEGCLLGSRESRCTRGNSLMYHWIVAPGYVRTPSGRSIDGYSNTQGTSFSAPIVAGAAALIQSRWPHLTPKQVRQILLRTAIDMGERGPDPIYGRGRLNINRALRPINGRVGGVLVRSAASSIFQRRAEGANFSHGVYIVDAFDREFNAVSYSYSTPAFLIGVPLGAEDSDVLLFFSSSDQINEGATRNLNGLSVGAFSYVSEILPETSYAHVAGIPPDIALIPDTLIELNLARPAVSYSINNALLFASLTQSSAVSEPSLAMVGASQLFEGAGESEITFTAAVLEQKGFHGLTSIAGFGFENHNRSVFFEAAIATETRHGSIQLNIGHHEALGGYHGSYINWDGLAVSEVAVHYEAIIGDGRLGVQAEFTHSSGDVSSSIRGLTRPEDFFHQAPRYGFNYSLEIGDLSSVNFYGRRDSNQAIGFEYVSRF